MRQPTDWTGWEGPCDKCGTGHGGFEPSTVDGETRCLVARAEGRVDVFLIDQARALEAHMHQMRDERLRSMGLDPDDLRARGFLPELRWELPVDFMDRPMPHPPR